jgi:hypothetical protein
MSSLLKTCCSCQANTAMVIPEAEFFDEIQTKVLRVFLLDIHSHLYSFALKFLFLQTHATSDVFLQLSYCTLQRK